MKHSNLTRMILSAACLEAIKHRSWTAQYNSKMHDTQHPLTYRILTYPQGLVFEYMRPPVTFSQELGIPEFSAGRLDIIIITLWVLRFMPRTMAGRQGASNNKKGPHNLELVVLRMEVGYTSASSTISITATWLPVSICCQLFLG